MQIVSTFQKGFLVFQLLNCHKKGFRVLFNINLFNLLLFQCYLKCLLTSENFIKNGRVDKTGLLEHLLGSVFMFYGKVWERAFAYATDFCVDEGCD